MIIFLDDDKQRCRAFKRFAGCPSTIVHTAQDCIKAIQETDDISILFLDHDLGGEVYVNSAREDCGMEVVRWIVANNPPIRTIIVHSLNAPAAQSMVVALKRAQYDAHYNPFTTLAERLKELHKNGGRL